MYLYLYFNKCQSTCTLLKYFHMYFAPCLTPVHINDVMVMLHQLNINIQLVRSETIWVNAVLRIALECIATYCHIVIFDWILVKKTFHMGIWVWQ